MSAMSNYLEKKVLDHILNVTAYTAPTTLYVALFTGTAADVKGRLEAGTLTDEVASANAYARETVTFNAATSGAGTTTNDGDVEFPAATGSWGTITCVAIMDAATSGNVLVYGELGVAKTITSGDIFKIPDDEITITLA
jgi:opacity protein-like surface antigen